MLIYIILYFYQPGAWARGTVTGVTPVTAWNFARHFYDDCSSTAASSLQHCKKLKIRKLKQHFYTVKNKITRKLLLQIQMKILSCLLCYNLQTVTREYGYPAFIYYSMCKKLCFRVYAEIMRINKLVNSMCFGKHAIHFCDFDAQGANAGDILQNLNTLGVITMSDSSWS